MTKSRTRLIVSLGSSHLTAARFSYCASRGLVLEDYASRHLDCDYSQQDDWLPALSAAGEVLRNMGLTGEADLIAPGFPLFLKTIKVPVVEKSRQEVAISCEAEQCIPYYMTDLVWDRQIMANDGIDLEVLLLACKLKIAGELCQYAVGMGLQPLSLRSDTISEYHSFRQNFPQNPANTLLVKIGARSSTFLYPKTDGFYYRGIPLGGISITVAIAEKLALSFAQAEKVKLRMADPTQPGALKSEDPSSEIAMGESRNFMDRLSLEINRSMAHFCRQDANVFPQRLLLSGRGALLPGLSDFLKSKHSLPVEFFNPLENVHLGERVDAVKVKREGVRLGDMVGHAWATLGSQDSLIDLDLLPRPIVRRRAFERSRPFFLGAACFLAFSLFLPLKHFRNASVHYQEQLAALDRQWMPLNAIQHDLADTLGRIEVVREKINTFEPLLYARGSWSAFLSDLQQRLVEVEDVWFDELQILNKENGNSGSQSGLRLHLAGRMLDRENPLAKVSSNVQNRVNRLLGAFSESEFVNKVVERKFDASGRGLLKFEFTLVMNPENLL